MVKVKICGVANCQDAILVANLGADYIGLNFCKTSPRKVSIKMAKTITSKLPSFIVPIGVFVDEDITVAAQTAKRSGLKMLQLHGDETPAYCLEIAALTGLPVMKAFRIRDEKSLEAMQAYRESVSYFLLDAYVPEVPGGTGETFNWDLAVKAGDLGKPFFLAGGLTPDNVSDAMEKVQPYAVDAASGVERLPTRKDYDKMKAFIRRARGLKG